MDNSPDERHEAQGVPQDNAPNIIFILVDQLRFPKVFPKGVANADQFLEKYMPNLYSLWTKGVKFSNYYTAAAACTPSRSTLVTGLYTHQTFMLVTRAIDSAYATYMPQPQLDNRFPTYGKLLREAGYDTPYIGKWHMSNSPNPALPGNEEERSKYLEEYGFQGLTMPDPCGSPGQGVGAVTDVSDALIASQAVHWLRQRVPAPPEQTDGETEAEQPQRPFCLTLGFVNPHDKAFFWGGAEGIQWKKVYGEIKPEESVDPNVTVDYEPALDYIEVVAEDNPPPCGYSLPPNWESREQFNDPTHPCMHRAIRDFYDFMTGGVSDDPAVTDFTTTPYVTQASDGTITQCYTAVAPFSYWTRALDMYTQVMGYVDTQIGQVIQNIPSAFTDKTIIVFTSDHGDYAGAHGIASDKAFTTYDESVRVPFIVYDPRVDRNLTAETEKVRDQLVSSVDVMPMLVSMGYPQNPYGWMTGDYAQFYGQRLNLLSILKPGGKNESATMLKEREYVLHTSDELIPSFWVPIDEADAANHIIGLITKDGKLGVYSHWAVGTNKPSPTDWELEYYDYTTDREMWEMTSTPDSEAARSALGKLFGANFRDEFLPGTIIHDELQAPLVGIYRLAHLRAREAYFAYVAMMTSSGQSTKEELLIAASSLFG